MFAYVIISVPSTLCYVQSNCHIDRYQLENKFEPLTTFHLPIWIEIVCLFVCFFLASVRLCFVV